MWKLLVILVATACLFPVDSHGHACQEVFQYRKTNLELATKIFRSISHEYGVSRFALHVNRLGTPIESYSKGLIPPDKGNEGRTIFFFEIRSGQLLMNALQNYERASVAILFPLDSTFMQARYSSGLYVLDGYLTIFGEEGYVLPSDQFIGGRAIDISSPVQTKDEEALLRDKLEAIARDLGLNAQ